MVLGRLQAIQRGVVQVHEGSACYTLGDAEPGEAPAVLTVHSPRFYRRVALGGALGAAESYLDGEWDSPDLVAAIRVLARNAEALARVESGAARLVRPARAVLHWLRRNTRAGSRRNIAAHYDLSNEFFGLMLDPTMTYSSGVYPHEGASLRDASQEKYDRVCRKLRLQPGDHVLEIGAGWGGFAEHAAREYGCRVTTTTISKQQHAYAAERLGAAGLSDRVTLLSQDYRDLSGQFDKLVSIEMIEAVGERFLPAFFGKCSSLLRPEGMMLLQSITIPDHRYQQYRRSVDFIQRYIFPGGFLPSPGAITQCLGSHTDFRLAHLEDFGAHYARTLRDWRGNFSAQLDRVRRLGFDQRFIRTWTYYLSYCEAAFWERQIGVAQLLLTKPASRAEPLI